MMPTRDAFSVTAGPGKPLTQLDRYLEQYFRALVVGDRFSDLYVIRTEDVTSSLDLTRLPRMCMLVDILDGAHLHHRQLSNWCSAITVFDRSDGRILGAYVAVPAVEKFYYATAADSGAFVLNVPGLASIESRPKDKDFDLTRGRSGGWNRIPVRVPNGTTALANATVCLYAQRCSHLRTVLAALNSSRLATWLTEVTKADGELQTAGTPGIGFRLLNLGGNPMLVRLSDGGTDVVIEVVGADANDWVPGAYIALKSGAYVGDLTGGRIDEAALSRALLGLGRDRTSYIAAANEELYCKTVDLLRSDEPDPLD